VGAQVPHFTAVDQYGDIVDLYDFAGRGAPIVIDMGTIFCGPCKAMAAYLSTGDMSNLVWDPPEGAAPGYYPWWSEDYEGLRDMIANEEIYWLTVLFNESVSGPSDQEECAEWDEAYPNPHIPVLADTNLELKTWLDIQSYPTLNLVSEDMVLEIHSTGGPYEVLRHLGDVMAAGN
jgi:thiol-disulfide isomerase/thioredoxin